jgi:hypothetical protein
MPRNDPDLQTKPAAEHKNPQQNGKGRVEPKHTAEDAERHQATKI